MHTIPPADQPRAAARGPKSAWIPLAVALVAALLLMITSWSVQAQDGVSSDAAPLQNGPIPGSFDHLDVIEAQLDGVTLGALRDSYTASNRPNTNFGGEENLAIGYRLSDGDLGALRTFIQFDFAGAIPSGATINRARVRLYQREATGLQDMRIVVRQPSGPWDEFGLTWGNQPGFAGDERASEFINSDPGFKEWNITGLVQEWQRGDIPHYGIILEGFEEPADNRRLFYSRHAGDLGLRPVLVIEYTPIGGATPPASRLLHPTNPYQTSADFRVEWSADDPSGVGIAYYDVQVRQPGENWHDWHMRTTTTAAVYVGQHGRTYEFRVRAVNQAGVAEPFPENAQARTTLDLLPPVVTVNPVPAFTNQAGILITWSGQDDISGLRNYDVQTRYGEGPWIDAAIGTLQTSYFLPGAEGVLAQLRVRASDNAGNLSSYAAAGATVGFTQDTTPPRACILRFAPSVLPTVSPFSVSWLGDDGPTGSGVLAYDVQYRFNSGPWLPFETGVAFTSAAFTPGEGAGFYEFRVRAVDGLGNRGEFRTLGADGSVRVGVELRDPEYFFPALATWVTDDPFLAQCRRQQ